MLGDSVQHYQEVVQHVVSVERWYCSGVLLLFLQSKLQTQVKHH